MTNLTEQYLNGNLQDGEEYYVENKDSEVSTMHLYNDTIHWHSFKVKKLKVLDKVPSYEEWQEYKDANDSMFDTIKMLNKDNYKLEKENTKLKELLKECRRPINYALCLNLSKEEKIEFKNLLAKIKQVLGEE